MPAHKILKSSTSITIVNAIGISFILGNSAEELDRFNEAVDLIDGITAEDQIDPVSEQIIALVEGNRAKARPSAPAMEDQKVSLSEAYVAKLTEFFKSIGVDVSEADDITIHGEHLPDDSNLHGLILGMALHEDSSFDSKRNFLDKLMNSHFSIEQVSQICNFMLRGNQSENSINTFEINEAGNFILYRGARVEGSGVVVDYHTGKVPQIVGAYYEMELKHVDKNPNQTCSHGLHISTEKYARGFIRNDNGILFKVEVDPRDIISVPTDYNFEKIRATKYKILEIVENKRTDVNIARNPEFILKTILGDSKFDDLNDQYTDTFSEIEDDFVDGDINLVVGVGRNGALPFFRFDSTDSCYDANDQVLFKND